MRYVALSAVCAVLCAFLFAAEERLLFDFRASQTNPAPTLAAEARRNVLSAVFPQYLGDETECKVHEPPTETALEAARNSGQIVPELLDRATGSFTRSGARQIAYLIKVGECGAQGRSYFGTNRLAVFENGRLIAADPSPGGEYIAAATDVAGDGIEEILIAGCGFGQAVVECSARLLSIAGGSVQTVRDFPEVYSDACGSSQDSGISATLIRYAPGRPPRFFEYEYKAPCPGPGQKPEFRPAAERKF
jgi:hypothetical protein